MHRLVGTAYYICYVVKKRRCEKIMNRLSQERAHGLDESILLSVPTT
jgi:hypothetical protein